jgi:hypothetical protein
MPCLPSGKTCCFLDLLMPLAWLAALLSTVIYAQWVASPTLGNDLTRFAIRLALGYYAISLTLMLLLHRQEWTAPTALGRAVRWCWTLAWASYGVHVLLAFHYYYAWSHSAAVAHTREMSGFGEGIWFSHLFTAAWTADVCLWWFRPAQYAARSRWVDRLLHGFMAFIIFNATVVYGEGIIRWTGLVLFAVLAAAWLYGLNRLRAKHGRTTAQTDLLV